MSGIVCILSHPGRDETLEFLLADEGFEVRHASLGELEPGADAQGTRAAAEQLGQYRSLAFETPEAVWAFVEVCRQASVLGQLRKLPAHGFDEETREAIRASGLFDSVPGDVPCLALAATPPADAFVEAAHGWGATLVSCYRAPTPKEWALGEVLVVVPNPADAHALRRSGAPVSLPVVAANAATVAVLQRAGFSRVASAATPAPEAIVAAVIERSTGL